MTETGWVGKATNHTCMDKPNKDYTGLHPTSSESGFCHLWSNLTGDAIQTDPKTGQALQHQIEEEQEAKEQKQNDKQQAAMNGTWVSGTPSLASARYVVKCYPQLACFLVLIKLLLFVLREL
jgi:hypothetical protein